ncbi:MAG: SDR family oxidoreductase [Verrucomicrobia bacterium]|nr:SDR family oxidoreductase [Verrucomicrobiota bacterium]
MRFENTRWVVVGGSAGMGLAIARKALGGGAEVTIAARSAEKLDRARQTLGGGVRAQVVDTTDEATVVELFRAAGEIDYLLIPGTALRLGPWRTMPVEDVLFSLRGKFVGPFLCARHARLRPGGSITFWSGILSRRPGQNDAVLAAVNAAVEGMTRALARDLAPLRVNCISPGMVAGTDAYLEMPAEAREQMFQAIAGRLPARRVGQPEDIASLAIEVATNPFLTGAVIDIDGGGIVA